jgi:1-hydroxycarotenoid 3,4-desaturase
MRSRRIVVVGAGAGGLAAAVVLASRGAQVTLLDRAEAVGGKLRQVDGIDAGPTVFTMPDVLDAVFAEAGESLSAHLTLRPVETLARHAWDAAARLDLFADLGRSADAIGDFAGPAAARGFLEFSARAGRIYETLDRPFMRRPRPGMARLLTEAGPAALLGISPFASLWRALGEHFADPRLRQLFGRYATYCGSSPFLAPATLMLVAHVERSGVWLVEGGMIRIAEALSSVAARQGVLVRYAAEVAEITLSGGRCTGVRLADGERIEADAVLCAADVAALAQGCFGAGAARAVPGMPVRRRSLSALTWAIRAETRGFPLSRHTVFFSRDYPAEFSELRAGRMPSAPTVYVCAQDRDDQGRLSVSGPERFLVIVNAPANGDTTNDLSEMDQCQTASFAELRRCGLELVPEPGGMRRTGPAQFAAMFPATGGGLYGQASHGWRAAFRRPGVRSRVPGLYLAGGSTHPGPGLSMAVLSGRMAAHCMLEDLASTSRSVGMAIAGGTSTR